MDSVCEDCTRGEEGVSVVDVGVGRVSGKERAHEGYFGGVLGDVRLDGEVGCAG